MRALISTNSYLRGEVLNLKIAFTFLRMNSEEGEKDPLDGEASQDASLRERALCESKEQLFSPLLCSLTICLPWPPFLVQVLEPFLLTGGGWAVMIPFFFFFFAFF